MDQLPVILRAGYPTDAEGLAFARYLDQAADGFFRFLIGSRSTEIIATAYIQPEHDYSYQYVTFAARGDAIVGMASGYTADQHRRASHQPLLDDAGGRALRMGGVALLYAPLLRFLDTVPDGDFYLQAIAVDQKLCGAGIGSMLIRAIEAQARAADSARLALDVDVNNEGAYRLYSRRGMTVEAKSPQRWFRPRSQVLRMVKVL